MNNPGLYAKCTSRLAGTITSFVLKKYLKNVKFRKENVSILDIGTGDGYTTVDLLLPKIPKKCKEIIGVDVSQEMIEYSTKRYQQPELRFIKMDITEKNIPAEFHQRFDQAFSFYLLHFVPNKRALLQNVFKMLTPEGDFLACYIINAPIFTNFITMSKYPSYKPLYPKELVEHFENFDTEQQSMEQLLKETGFTNYFCTTEEKTLAWRNPDEYRQLVASVDPIVPKFSSQDDKEKYLDDFMRETRKMDKITFVPDENDQGVVLAEYKVLVVYASKDK